MREQDLFQAYKKDVYKTCFFMLHHASDAEDVCQEVFITVFRQEWTQIEHLKTWLIRVTVNHCLNHLKKSRRTQIRERKLQLHSYQAVGVAVEVIAEEHESTMECVRLLQQLPGKIRAVVSLRFLNDYSLNEIAEILSIPLGTVKSRLHKGLQMMKLMIEPEELNLIEGGDRYGQDRADIYSVSKG